MSRLLAIFTFFTILNLIHCKIDKNKGIPNVLDFKKKLVIQDTVTFSIEEAKSTNFHSITYNDEMETVSILDEYQKCILIYQYESRKLIDKICFETEGENGIRTFYRLGHLIHTPDSIFVFNNLSKEIMLFDNDAVIQKRYKLASVDFANNAHPVARTLKPITLVKNKIYLAGLFLDPYKNQDEVHNFYQLDIESGRLDEFVTRPKIYVKGTWGILHPYQFFYTYNPTANTFLFSFGLLSDIYSTDLNLTKFRKYHLPSVQDIHPRKPLTRDPMDQMSDKPAGDHYDFTNLAYYGILYDTYNDYYYRMVSHPLSEDEYRTSAYGSRPQKPSSIIIIDDSYNIIGETFLPRETLNLSQSIVTPDGLLIMKKQQNENEISFIVFNAVDYSL